MHNLIKEIHHHPVPLKSVADSVVPVATPIAYAAEGVNAKQTVLA